MTTFDRRDRRDRRQRSPADRRRRPSDGYRAPSAAAFDDLVDDALRQLPQDIADRLDNIQITVEDVPPTGPGDGILLGLYEGTPQPERTWGAPLLPDRVTIYRRPLEARSADATELAEHVRETVIHEIAHHFGIDDDRLDDLGWG